MEPDDLAQADDGSVRPFDVAVASTHRCTVRVANGLLEPLGGELAARFGQRTFHVVTDENVARLHLDRLARSLASAGLRHTTSVVPPGETSKSLATFGSLLERLTSLGAQRRDVVLNFGGGMICDLGGFVAASHLRGVPYVNVPTSLIGQLDAAIGGKVAVDTPAGKNLVGAFHHPELVAADPTLLATLPLREYRSGIAEAIKIAVIASPELFTFLRERAAAVLAREPESVAELVVRAARLKARRLEPDPLERELRRPLNFGHTIGHALEADEGYRGLLHGEAVAVGMQVAATIARSRGLLAADDATALDALLRSYGLADLVDSLPVARLEERLRTIRLVRDGKLFFVLPRAIGAVEIVDDLLPGELEAAAEKLFAAPARARSRRS